MTRRTISSGFETRTLLGALVLLLFASQALAIAGHWRRCARRTAVVVGSSEAAASSAEAQQQQETAQQQTAAAEKAASDSAAAAQQAAAAANQAAAAASKPAASKTPQQKLEDLQSLYKQGLISESDYNAAKAKILAEME